MTMLPEHEGRVVDLVDMDIPMYGTDEEKANGVPTKIVELYTLIQSYEAVIIASPEHNGLMPAAFKNIIDWMSRHEMKFLAGKPAVLLSTSPGGGGGANGLKVIQHMIGYWGATEAGIFSLPSFYDNFDSATGTLKTEEHRNALGQALDKLMELTPSPTV